MKGHCPSWSLDGMGGGTVRGFLGLVSRTPTSMLLSPSFRGCLSTTVLRFITYGAAMVNAPSAATGPSSTVLRSVFCLQYLPSGYPYRYYDPSIAEYRHPPLWYAFLHVEDGYWGDSVLHGSRRLSRPTQVLSLQCLQLEVLYVPAVANPTCGLAGMIT